MLIPILGVDVVNLTSEIAANINQDPNSALEVPEVNGILVVRVVPNSPAATCGVRRGDVCLRIDDKPVTTVEQLQGIVDNRRYGQMLTINIQRNKQNLPFSIRIDKPQDRSK